VQAGPRLHRDDGEPVSDDVVHLLRHPQPFLRHRAARLLGAHAYAGLAAYPHGHADRDRQRDPDRQRQQDGQHREPARRADDRMTHRQPDADDDDVEGGQREDDPQRSPRGHAACGEDTGDQDRTERVALGQVDRDHDTDGHEHLRGEAPPGNQQRGRDHDEHVGERLCGPRHLGLVGSRRTGADQPDEQQHAGDRDVDRQDLGPPGLCRHDLNDRAARGPRRRSCDVPAVRRSAYPEAAHTSTTGTGAGATLGP
jgi:hypothetical protein